MKKRNLLIFFIMLIGFLALAAKRFQGPVQFVFGTAANDNQIIMPQDTTGNLDSLTRVEGALYYDSTLQTMRVDDGSSLLQLSVGAKADVDLANLTAPTAINRVLLGLDGTGAAPAYSFTSDATNGMFLQAADTLGFSAAGTDRFRVSASVLRVNTTSGLDFVASGTEADPIIGFEGDSGLGIFRAGTDIMGFTAAGTEKFRFTATA